MPYYDQWAYQPISSFITGWTTAVELFTNVVSVPERTGKYKAADKAFCMHSFDMHPPKELAMRLLDLNMAIPRGYAPLVELVSSEEFKEVDMRTPCLPCYACHLKNLDVEGGVTAPRGLPPKKWKDDEDWLPFMIGLKKVYKEVRDLKKNYSAEPSVFAKLRAAKNKNYNAKIKSVRAAWRKKNRY